MNIFKMLTNVTRAFTIGLMKLQRKKRFNSTQREKSMKSMYVRIMRKYIFLKQNVLHSKHL